MDCRRQVPPASLPRPNNTCSSIIQATASPSICGGTLTLEMHGLRLFHAHWLFRCKRMPRLWRRAQSTGGDKQAASHHFESRTPSQARSPGTTYGRLSPVSLMSNGFGAHRRVAIGTAVRTRRRACQPAPASSLSISLPMRRRRGLRALDETLSGPPIAGLKFIFATAALHH